MDTDVYKIMIVTLLHDVGKVLQRSGKYNKNLCGLGKDFYEHDKYSCSFIKEYLGEDYAELFKQKVWHVADVVTASEREPLEESKDITSTPLKFPTIEKYYNVTYVDFNATKETYRLLDRKDAFTNYEKIYDTLIRLAEKAKMIKDSQSLLETYDYIYRTTTLLVPSAVYKAQPDISLYAHSRLAATFSPYKKFRLLLIDFSGIQKFVTNVTRESEASKRLRGRSFFLQLLQIGLTDKLAEMLKVSSMSNLMPEPGKIFLPIGERESCEKVKKLLLDLTDWLDYELQFKMTCSDETYDTSQLAFSSEPTSDKINFNEVTDRLFRELEIIKPDFTQIGNVIKAAYQDFFYSISSRVITDKEKFKVIIPGEEVDRVSLINFITLILGHYMRGAEYIIEVIYKDKEKGENRAHEGYGEIYIDPLNIGFFIINNKDKLEDALESVKGKCERIKILKVNESVDFIGNVEEFLKVCDKITFGYINISTYHPMTPEGNFKSLDDMGNYIAIGFIDGDRIGETLRNLKTLGRQFTFSLLLDFVFSHIVYTYIQGQIQKQLGKSSETNLVLLYSGGDDLAVYGKWDEVLKLISELGSFIPEVLNISVSGGVFVFKQKYPIYYAYFNARKLEDEAKSQKKKFNIQEGVASSNIFEYYINQAKTTGEIAEISRGNYELTNILRWEDVSKAVNTAEELSRKKEIPSSFLYKIYEIASGSEESLRSEIDVLRSLVSYAYLIARNEKSFKDAREIIIKSNVFDLPDYPKTSTPMDALNNLLKVRTVINMYSMLSRE